MYFSVSHFHLHFDCLWPADNGSGVICPDPVHLFYCKSKNILFFSCFCLGITYQRGSHMRLKMYHKLFN